MHLLLRLYISISNSLFLNETYRSADSCATRLHKIQRYRET